MADQRMKDSNEDIVDTSFSYLCATLIDAYNYIECSSLHFTGVKEAFIVATEAIIGKKMEKNPVKQYTSSEC